MFDRGKLFSTESTLCAEFIVQPSLRNAAADDLPVEGDGKRTVTVCSDFEDDSQRRELSGETLPTFLGTFALGTRLRMT